MGRGVKRSAASNVDDDVPAKKFKKSSSSTAAVASGDGDKDAFGNRYWAVTNKRGVTVSKMKDSTFINIREFYDKDKNGEKHPGKGISLTPEQWKDFLKLIPSINEHLAAQGIEIDADVPVGAKAAKAKEPAAKESSKSAKSKKANIEATSDEDDEEDDE